MKKFLILSLLCLPSAPLFAQCRPLSARIGVAGDDLTQVWINGAYVGQKAFCDGKNGCDQSQLWLPVPLDLLQGPLVCLAIRTENTNPEMVYSSWALEVDCGDRIFEVSSKDPDRSEIKLYWDGSGGPSCGAGTVPLSDGNGNNWMSFQYQPSSDPFVALPSLVTANTWSAVHLMDPQTAEKMPFVSYDPSAVGSGSDHACGILYWRQVAALPHFLPTFTPTAIRTPTPTDTWTSTPTFPAPTFTPRPRATATPTRTWTRWPTFTPWPTSTPTRPVVQRPRRIPPTWTPVPARPVHRSAPVLPALPLPVLPAAAPPVAWVPTSTPIPRAAPPAPPVAPRAAPPQAPSHPKGLPPFEKEETLAFSTFPAAIYVTFTGPGHYQLEVVDASLKAVRVIYDERVEAQTNAWVEWDGKNSIKRDAPPGNYYLVYFKDGKAIKTLPISRAYKVP